MSVTIKSQREIELMRHAGKLLGQTLKQLEEAVRPGMSTWELNQIGEEIISRLFLIITDIRPLSVFH